METEDAKPRQSDQPDNMFEEVENSEFDTLIANLESTDEKVLLDTVTHIKHMLYANPNLELETTIAKLINKGALEGLAKIIKTSDNFELKYQAIWAFVNVCCGNSSQIKKVVEVGVVDAAVNLIENAINDPDDKHTFSLALESVWLLGNIGGDSFENREACLDRDAAQRIVELVQKHPHHEKLLDHAVWSLQNLVSRKPAPFWNQIADAYKLFQSIVEKGGRTNVEYYALWGICYISASYVLDVIQSGCIPTLIKYIGCEENRFIFPALQALGNLISTTKDQNTDEVLKHPDFLPLLFKLCSSSNEKIRVYATWAVSNIAAGTPEQISKIIEHPDYINQLNEQLHDSDDKIRYQASCALANLVFRATIDQVEQLVTKHKYLDSLLEIMKQTEPRIYERNIIEPIDRIVKLDSGHRITPIFKQKGLIEQMQQISSSLSYEMRTMANELINKHLANIPDPSARAHVHAPATDRSSEPTSHVATAAATTANTPKASQSKVAKPQVRKKIVKVHNIAAGAAKNPIKRTKTMMKTLEEAEEFIKGVNKRTRKSNKPAAVAAQKKTPTKQNKEKEGTAKKFKRTNTMKQTLSEAKKILKQIGATRKK